MKRKATIKMQIGRTRSGTYEMGVPGCEWSEEMGFAKGYLFGFCDGEFEGATGLSLERDEVADAVVTIQLEESKA